MTIDLIGIGNTQTLRVHLTNNGGVARGVEFAAAAAGRMVYGPPHPAPLFRPGESRLIETAISVTPDDEVIGFVSCYDATGTLSYAWWPSGKHEVYRIAGRRPDRVSAEMLMKRADPSFDFAQMTKVRYNTLERTF
jgi:hypothetical protein